MVFFHICKVRVPWITLAGDYLAFRLRAKNPTNNVAMNAVVD
jgi:hypothetical protein